MSYHLKHGQVKQELIKDMTPYYKEQGFKKSKIEGGSICFQKDLAKISVCTLYTSNSYGISGGQYELSFKEVEDVISVVKYPGFHEERSTITIHDVITHPIEENGGNYYYRLDLFSVEESEDVEDFVFEYRKFVNKIIHYINNEGKNFIEHYSYLPNILIEMDKMESEGLNWNNMEKGILYGTLDAYFRGLIISKLCNDPQFRHKIEIMDVKFAQKGYEAWVPHYEKLKLYLETLEPIYNI